MARAEGENETAADLTCWRAEVFAHVHEQIRLYGPLSVKREYFGFIYRDGQAVKSSVVKGPLCDTSLACSVHSRGAAEGLPRGVKVLGEWHTHPNGDSSNGLSAGDVRGAWNNRKIRCYTAFYAASNGRFYSWNPASTSVAVAMSSRVLLGNYRKPASDSTVLASHEGARSNCVSAKGVTEADAENCANPEAGE